jgi:fructosamine-3-kinase
VQREVAATGGRAEDVSIKWVNDILVNNKKIGGVKPNDIDSTSEIVSYQFAINVNMPQEYLAQIDQPATSLSVECGKFLDHERILREVVVEIVKLLKQYKNKKDIPSLDREFSSHMAFIGEDVIVYDYVPGKNIEGILEKIENGKLYIRTGNGATFEIRPGSGLLRGKKKALDAADLNVRTKAPEDILSADFSERIENVLKNVTSEKNSSTSRLARGHADIFKVETFLKKYAIKFLRKCCSAFDKEADLANLASKLGFGPKVYLVDQSSRAIVMEFLQAIPITLQLVHNDDGIFYAKLAAMLKTLHGTKPIDSVRKLDEFFIVQFVQRRVEKFLQRMKADKKVDPDLVKQLELAKKTAFSKEISGAGNILCHCDLHPGNVFYTSEGCYAIDYETASLCDPICDIAIVLLCWCPTKREESIFLNHYFTQGVSPETLEKINIIKKIAALCHVIFQIRIFKGNEIKLSGAEPTSYLEFVKKYGFIRPETDEQILDFIPAMLNVINNDA